MKKKCCLDLDLEHLNVFQEAQVVQHRTLDTLKALQIKKNKQ